MKKQTKTTPSKKKEASWGEAKKFLFCVAEKANLFSYCNIRFFSIA